MTLMIQINTGVWLNIEHITSIRQLGMRVIVGTSTGVEYDAHVTPTPGWTTQDTCDHEPAAKAALAALISKVNHSAEIIRRGPPINPATYFKPHSQD